MTLRDRMCPMFGTAKDNTDSMEPFSLTLEISWMYTTESLQELYLHNNIKQSQPTNQPTITSRQCRQAGTAQENSKRTASKRVRCWQQQILVCISRVPTSNDQVRLRTATSAHHPRRGT